MIMAFKKTMQADQHGLSDWSLVIANALIVFFALLGFALNSLSGLGQFLSRLRAIPVCVVNSTRKLVGWIRETLSNQGAENVWYRRMYRD
jgi:hypothetical protein